MIKTILFFSDTVFNVSETFIFNQINSPLIKNEIIISYNIHDKLHTPKKLRNYKIKDYPIGIPDRILSKLLRILLNTGTYTFPFSAQLKLHAIIKKHAVSLIHCNYGNNALKLLPISRFLDIPIITHFHGYDSSKLLNDPIYFKNLKKIFKFSAKVITVSSDMFERLSKFGLTKDKNITIPYGIDLSKFKKRNFEKSNLTTLQLLHAGRLTPKKGVIELVKVFHSILSKSRKKLFLTIIGDGVDKVLIENYITQNNLQTSIKLLGAQPNSIVIGAMQSTDIFVLNSRTSEDGDMEGFPNTIMEAMAAGCAVVSTFHAGIPDAIDNNVNGLLVEERNNNSLKDAILSLISNDELRIKLQKNAQIKAFNQFSVLDMQKAYYNVYKSILDNDKT